MPVLPNIDNLPRLTADDVQFLAGDKYRDVPAKWDQMMARAQCEAGYMSVAEYIRLCEREGWLIR